ncbi:MAG: cytochrome C, partial [Alphaproteobacteria bacterium]
DGFHAGLLIDTVTRDLAADASVMRNLAAKPDVYRLSTALADVGVAIAAERWDEAERGWAAFKSLQTELDPEMY